MTFAISGKNFPNFGLYGIQKANTLISQSIEKLSSANNIPNASFDPAGLTVSQQFRGQIRGFYKASNNIQDGISLLRTAEGGLSQIQEGVQRLKEIAVQAGNGTYSDAERKALEEEARQIIGSIDDTAKGTEFNKRKLLDGNTSGRVSSASPGVEGFVHGDVGRGGVYKGEISSKFDENGERILELTLSNRNNGTTKTTLDSQNRANNALQNVDLQFGEISSAEIQGQEIAFEETISFAEDAEATFTDADGNSSTVQIAAGTYTREQLETTFNDSFANDGVALQAEFSEEGNVEVSSTEEDKGFAVSDTNSSFAETLGLRDATVAAETGETSSYEGETNESAVSEGVQFDAAVSFRAQGSSVVAANISVGGAGQTMTKEQVLEQINKGLQNLDVQAKFDENRLVFQSAAVGRESNISITNTSSDAENTLGISDQSDTGSGSTRFAVNVRPANLSFQTGSNPGQNTSFSFGNFTSRSMGIDNVDFSTSEGISDFLGRVSQSSEKISSARSQIGARENSLTSQFNNITTSTQNATASESRIRDLDMAKELMKMSTQQALLDSSLYVQAQTMNMSSPMMLSGLL
jgi:flagellin